MCKRYEIGYSDRGVLSYTASRGEAFGLAVEASRDRPGHDAYIFDSQAAEGEPLIWCAESSGKIKLAFVA